MMIMTSENNDIKPTITTAQHPILIFKDRDMDTKLKLLYSMLKQQKEKEPIPQILSFFIFP